MFRTHQKIFHRLFPLDWLIIWSIYQGVFWGIGMLGGMNILSHGEIYADQKRGKPEKEEAFQIPAEAFWGEPVGVARIALPVGPPSHPLGLESLVVTCPQNRVFYPAVEEGPLRALLREKTGLVLGRANIYFLFPGKEPLEVELRTPRDFWTVRLVPGEHRRAWIADSSTTTIPEKASWSTSLSRRSIWPRSNRARLGNWAIFSWRRMRPRCGAIQDESNCK